MVGLLLKTTGIWLLTVIIAIVNAVLREKLLTPRIGAEVALPLSGLVLSMFILVIAFMSIPFIGLSESKICILVGMVWLVLTLSFEFLFGHYVAGKPWYEIMQVFNIKKGDLFIVVLLVTAISPWLCAKLRGLV
jgi:hypothetical protein